MQLTYYWFQIIIIIINSYKKIIIYLYITELGKTFTQRRAVKPATLKDANTHLWILCNKETLMLRYTMKPNSSKSIAFSSLCEESADLSTC